MPLEKIPAYRMAGRARRTASAVGSSSRNISTVLRIATTRNCILDRRTASTREL